MNYPTFVEGLWARARMTPGALAVHDDRGEVNFSELETASRRMASWLRNNEVGPGDRVAIAMQPSAAYLAAVLAVWQAGAVATPLNTRLSPTESDRYLDVISPRYAWRMPLMPMSPRPPLW